MSAKPESSFIKGVHAKLPNTYKEKMNNPYRGGTPDVWYSGNKGDLWIEYKCIPRIPIKANVLPDLSPNQQIWLAQRHADGRNVVVIVGVERGGGVIYEHLDWMQPLTPAEFVARLVSKDDIAAFILKRVGVSECLSTTVSIKPPRSPRRSTSS